MNFRRIVRRSSAVLAALAAFWGTILLLSGGFTTTILGVEVRAHDSVRPLILAAIAFVTFVLTGGRLTVATAAVRRALQQAASLWRSIERRLPGPSATAWLLAIGMSTVAWVWGTKAVGGSDSYGYLSQAELWAKGDLHVRMPWVKDVPWSSALWTFTPLAYRMDDGGDGTTIVPVYSPGLSILLAAVKLVAGYQAMFFVVPVLSGLLVLATYRIGAHLTSRPAALIGAWLVATSPAVLFMMMTTMTDVPVAGVWAGAFWLMLVGSSWSAAGAGLASGAAILIRPNLAPLVAAMGIYYLLRLRQPRGFLQALLFGLGIVPGVVAVALINQHLYGSPTSSGYGPLEQYFSWRHIVPNLRLYPAWLADSQTPVALAGLVAALLPLGWLWGRDGDRAGRLAGSLFVMALWFVYLVYDPYDAWWYLRFLLPSWPFIMIGTGVVAVAITRSRPRLLTPIVTVLLLLLGIYQVRVAASRSTFDLWAGERRFVVGARMVRSLTDRNSVVIAGQHTGTVRFYGGRVTMHWDHIDESLDEIVDWLNARRIPSYLLLEEWEVEGVKKRFAGQRAIRVFEQPPFALYKEPGTLFLYSLSSSSAAPPTTQFFTGTYRSVWAAAPAPTPTLNVGP